MTPDMHRTLRLIDDYKRLYGYPPTQREIAAARGNPSSSAGAKAVRRLEAEGLIEVVPRRSRGIRITNAGMKALTEAV